MNNVRIFSFDSLHHCHVLNQFMQYADCAQHIAKKVRASLIVEGFRLERPEFLFSQQGCVGNLVAEYYEQEPFAGAMNTKLFPVVLFGALSYFILL